MSLFRGVQQTVFRNTKTNHEKHRNTPRKAPNLLISEFTSHQRLVCNVPELSKYFTQVQSMVDELCSEEPRAVLRLEPTQGAKAVYSLAVLVRLPEK